MKRFLLSLGILASLVLPATALATSGACSGHGGVNCSAGADSDGSVICNDSWHGSSVSYSSMAMCGAPSYTAPSYTPPPTRTYVAPEPVKTCPLHATLQSTGACACDPGYQIPVNVFSCVPILNPAPIVSPPAVATPVPAPVSVPVDMLSYCRTRLGSKAGYDAVSGNCICASGFVLAKGICAPKFFLGTPVSKTDLLNCAVVGDTKAKKYYLRGDVRIKSLLAAGKYCFSDETQAKKGGYKKKS